MRFQVLTIGGHAPHPLTGEQVPAADRLTEIVKTGVAAEELGFDAYAIGERHAGPFLSSSPTVLLGALAARTSRIRLLTGVTVLAVLDPVRVAEDYATLHQLSRGRLELVIGKGAEAATSTSSASTRASSGTTRPRSTSCCAGSGARRTSPGRASSARP